jgi:hypothetical protein
MVDFPSVHERTLLQQRKHRVLSTAVEKLFSFFDELGKMDVGRLSLRAKFFNAKLNRAFRREPNEMSRTIKTCARG